MTPKSAIIWLEATPLIHSNDSSTAPIRAAVNGYSWVKAGIAQNILINFPEGNCKWLVTKLRKPFQSMDDQEYNKIIKERKRFRYVNARVAY